ncbi:MAG: DUF3105 domain-containing protein [Armatimonadota bacterium]|nr:DUF3105 domain-containing protein [Armatimonadota bacterium]MDR7533716.1 DUF3105 domain-containing protein [Armatimonadota bacterium]MDR7535497.1 DUF3105 domain-containing protein [Armatimonadota bacterium]
MAGSTAREAKHQRREAAREARRQAQRQEQTRRRRRQVTVYGSVAAGAVVLVALIVWSALRPGPGDRIPGQGRQHIALGQPHPPYNSNPPTSGWHTGNQVAPWGVHREPIPDEIVVHNLEHGGIWISYRDPKDTALVEKLEELVGRYRSKVILTPRPQNDRAIAVAAWERLLTLDAYDEGRIVAFINAYRNRGPEKVPD